MNPRLAGMSFSYTWSALPTAIMGPMVDSITPNTGSIDGGTPVTISGLSLSTALSVNFDGIDATDFLVVDDQTITCTTPAHAEGEVTVTVHFAGVDPGIIDGFTYG
jgi:hypothetical protein